MKPKLYEAPQVSVIIFISEGCLASSVGGVLQDMDKNDIYDEQF